MKRIILALIFLAAASLPASAQINVPNTFTPNTRIISADVNENFDELGDKALNRTGGTMTGALVGTSATFSGAVSVSGNFTASGTLNTLSATTTVVSNANPIFALAETDAAANNKYWDLTAVGETFYLRAVNDAYSISGIIMQADRTGATVDNVKIPAKLAVGDASATLNVGPYLNVGGDSTVTLDSTNYGRAIQTTRSTSGTGQHIAMVRASSAVWSLGFLYNTSNFAIGAGQPTDSNFTSAVAALWIEPVTYATHVSNLYVGIVADTLGSPGVPDASQCASTADMGKVMHFVPTTGTSVSGFYGCRRNAGGATFSWVLLG